LLVLALIPFLTCSLRTSYFGELVASDASEYKAGVVSASIDPLLQRQEAFSLLGEMSLLPSDRILPPSRITISEKQRALIAKRALVTVNGIQQPALASPHPLPAYSQWYEVARKLQWSTIISSRWRWAQHINALELHAVLSTVRWLASRPSTRRTRVVQLIDSTVALYAVKKGRAKSRALLSVLRVMAAYLLAAEISLIPIWIPSEFNPADAPSREP
jgi:hypothetical protein